MTPITAAVDDPELANSRQLLRLINSAWISQTIAVAAKLGIADLLAKRPHSPEEVARATSTNTAALQQLLCALSSLDIFRQLDDGTFDVTPLGKALTSDARYSMRGWATYWGDSLWQTWENMLYSVQTGASGRSLLTGTEGFNHLTNDPQLAETFNQAMANMTRLIAHDVVRGYDFGGKKIVDVGGGYGELLAALLLAFPSATGILFDMPHAIGEALRRFRERGLDDRCEFIAGDFFARVPDSGEIYLLKSVIHDWPDERALTILESCRRHMSATAKLLLVERVMPLHLKATPEDQILAFSNLNMLVAHGARERTQSEYDALLAKTGFSNARYIPVGSFTLIEAQVAS